MDAIHTLTQAMTIHELKNFFQIKYFVYQVKKDHFDCFYSFYQQSFVLFFSLILISWHQGNIIITLMFKVSENFTDSFAKLCWEKYLGKKMTKDLLIDSNSFLIFTPKLSTIRDLCMIWKKDPGKTLLKEFKYSIWFSILFPYDKVFADHRQNCALIFCPSLTKDGNWSPEPYHKLKCRA